MASDRHGGGSGHLPSVLPGCPGEGKAEFMAWVEAAVCMAGRAYVASWLARCICPCWAPHWVRLGLISLCGPLLCRNRTRRRGQRRNGPPWTGSRDAASSPDPCCLPAQAGISGPCCLHHPCFPGIANRTGLYALQTSVHSTVWQASACGQEMGKVPLFWLATSANLFVACSSRIKMNETTLRARCAHTGEGRRLGWRAVACWAGEQCTQVW